MAGRRILRLVAWALVVVFSLWLVAAGGNRLGAAEVGPDMDLHRPTGKGPWPAVLVIHGGGWANGDKRDVAPLCRALAARGLLGVAVNHRLAPDHPFPAPFEDVQRALAQVRRLPEVDPARIGVLGKSSGGHLAAMLAMGGGIGAAALMCAPLDLAAEGGGKPTAAQQLALQRAFGGDRELVRRFSPILHITPEAPPFLLIHGEADDLVPAWQSRRFHERLRRSGVDSTLVVVRHAGHGFQANGGTPDRTPAQLEELMIRFMVDRLGYKPGTRRNVDPERETAAR